MKITRFETIPLAMAPHNAAGPIGVAASIHAMASVPNFLICEGGRRRGQGLFKEPLAFRDAFIELPTGPGLGIEGAKSVGVSPDMGRINTCIDDFLDNSSSYGLSNI